MILREIFYLDKESLTPSEDFRYEPEYDDSIVNLDDVRKTRLTLKQINRIRKSTEKHQEEKEKELNFIKQMYGVAAQGGAEGMM